MDLRRFLGRLAGFFALQACIAALLAWPMLHEPPSRNFLAADLDKHDRLARLSSPRIVFVGGSATAFGIDSPRLERALGRPVVNMGLYQPLGLEFMLNEVEGALRPGDLVVVSPEYSLLFDHPSADALRQLVELNPAALRWLPTAQARGMIDRVHKPLGVRARRAIQEGFLGFEREEDPFPPYSRDSFNEYGDVVAHAALRARPIVVDRYFLGSVDLPVFRRNLERLNRFHQACLARGVRDLYSYPAAVQGSVELQRADFDAVIGEIERVLDMPRLHGAAEMIFPASLFFDSKEHLTLEGKTRRTDILIRCMSLLLRL
jgi:hypothetical protein